MSPHASVPAGPGDSWIHTPRLDLRRPQRGDLDDYIRLHTDPRTYAHRPSAMPSREKCRERLERDLEHWEREQIGYASVRVRDGGAVIGWAGLRVERDFGEPYLNLYVRLAHESIGAGFGREVARALVAWAAEHRPDLRVRAVVADVNEASRATCRSAGLVDVGVVERPDLPGAAHGDEVDFALWAPALKVVRADNYPSDPAAVADLARDLLDLWVRVNDAGGAVGFVPGATRQAVGVVLESHLDAVRSGESLLCVLRDPDETVRGFGFWVHHSRVPFGHVAGLKRLMVDPTAQGRNLGRVLLAAMVGAVRRELPEVQVLRLDYRGGHGLGDFYASCGWVEVGRVPGGLWLGGTDYRDDVAMARRVDGAPLVTDPRA